MPKPRKTQVCLDSTPYYHCISRCVRRTFLCGIDKLSKNNYEHRRQWIVDKLTELSEVFTIDICAYAIMSNHYHLVLHVDRAQAKSLSNEEVVDRWAKLFSQPQLIAKLESGQKMCEAEIMKCHEIIDVWRSRLYDLSWFMRYLNESLARMANAEDNCTGRFWEGRFKSQALLDEAALLTCMSYVDLNPIRANMADTPETSDYTAIQARIKAHQSKIHPQTNEHTKSIPLMAFIGNERENSPKGIPFHYRDYLALVDWTGRAIRDDKSGHIPKDIAPILERLNLDQEQWVSNVKYFESRFPRVVGALDIIINYSHKMKVKWVHKQTAVKRLYKTAPS